MGVILVCPTAKAPALIAVRAPSHVLGFASPRAEGREDSRPERSRTGEHRPEARERDAILRFHDIDGPRPGLVPPDEDDVKAILALGLSWDSARPILLHCQMGVSRSPAAALILACSRDPERSEADHACALRAAAPCATPNRLMIDLADRLLGREGRLVQAAASMGRGAEYRPQAGFELTLTFRPAATYLGRSACT